MAQRRLHLQKPPQHERQQNMKVGNLEHNLETAQWVESLSQSVLLA